MAKLLVVRHAAVRVDYAVPPARWELSEPGRRRTRELAKNAPWQGIVRIYHSAERKAVATAAILSHDTGIATVCAPGLGELTMPLIPARAEFIRRMERYLAGTDEEEFESWSAATRRIVHCVEDIVAESPGQSVAIVSHGRILTVFYSHLLRRRLNVADWQSIALPDWSIVDTTTWTVERGFLAGGQSVTGKNRTISH